MLLLLLSFVFSTPSYQSIVVCYNSCPQSTPGHLIEVSSSDSLSSQIDRYLGGTKTDIYFYNESQFTFILDIKVFQSHTVEIQRLDDSKPAFIEFDCSNVKGKSSGSFSFENVNVKFSSTSHLSQIEFDSLTFNKTNIDLDQIDNSLVVGSLKTDDSIFVFSKINVKISYASSTGVTLNFASNPHIHVSTIDYGAEITYNSKILTFNYDLSLSSKKFDIDNTDLSVFNCELEYKCTDISKLIEFSLIDLKNVYFLNNWQDSAVINVINDDQQSSTISANSTVCPVSIKGNFTSTIVLTQDSTIITGDITAPISFISQNDKSSNRKTIDLKGHFSGSLMDLGSSYNDVTLASFETDISSFGEFPFIFRVGTGGSSTLLIKQTKSETTKKTGIKVYPDFDKYLPDESLQNLLSKNWTIMKLTGTSFAVNYIDVTMPSEPFIHGFIDHDSCISVRIEQNSLILSTTPPSILPLNICFDDDKDGGECKTEDGIEINSIDSITDYFEDGMKYLNLSIKTPYLNSLDLTKLDFGYSGVRIILRGGAKTVLDTIKTKDGLGVDYLEINNLTLGSTAFWIKEINFVNCKASNQASFTFNKCQVVTGDDDFIQSISPCISSTSKIPKVSYRMDKYDSITVSNNKYIFYDLAINDLSEPAELHYDIVDFLDIIYDVGFTPTAQDNNLNVTMQTANPPSFNITFSPIFSSGIWDNPELILYSWAQTKSSNFKVYFIHDKLNVKIVLTQPYKPSQIIPVGAGFVTYEDRYNNSISLCTTVESDKGKCPQGSSYVSFDSLNTKLADLAEDNITLYIFSTSSNFPSIDLFNVNEKTTYFIGLQTGSKPIDVVQLSSSKDVDLSLTTTVFKNINIQPSSKTNKLVFGEVRIDNAAFDSSFKNVEISVDDFFCEYQILTCFKKMTITDNLIVSGELATEESTVNFIPDENANDLNATIISDVSLIIGDKSIKIGKTTFKFGSIENVYDIVLYLESTAKNIKIDKENSVSENLIPNVLVKKTSGATLTFSGNWNLDQTRVQPHIFLFSDFDKSKVYLSGPNTPISFSSSGELTLVSTSENTGILGYFEFNDLSNTNIINLLYEGVSKSSITVAQDLTISTIVTVKFSQPNIQFNVKNINGNSRFSSLIQPEFYSNLIGDSLFVVQGRLSNAIISTNYKVQIPIIEDISKQTVIDYYSKNHTLVKLSKSDIGTCSVNTFKLIGTLPTTHGFLESNINIKIDEVSGEISLYFIKSPLLIPFNLCYGIDESSCEIVLSENNVNNFVDLLPSGSLNIQARFGKENTNNFNLNDQKIKGSNVFISSSNSNQISVKINVGNGILSMLSLNKISGKIVDSSFKVNRVELINSAEIDKVSGFDIINIDYDTVWKVREFPKCSNHIILNISASILSFTKSGWKVNSDNEILASSYQNMNFQLDKQKSTKLEAEENIVEVIETTIYAPTNQFILGSNWASITSTSSIINIVFEDTANTNDILVTTSSYPFIPYPQLMSSSSISIDQSVLPYKVPCSVTLNNVKSEIDFSNVASKPEKAQINFESVIIQGTTSLSVKGLHQNSKNTSNDSNNNNIKIDQLQVLDGSTVTISNTLINKYLGVFGDSTLSGDFEVSEDLNIEMKWKLNKIPTIKPKNVPVSVPQLIKFTFDGDSFKGQEKDYEKYLYHRSFELIQIIKQTRCDSWKSNLLMDSPSVPLFGSQSIFDVSCNDGSLVIYGARHVNNGKKLGGGAIFGIIFVVIVVVGIGCFAIYYFLKKRKTDNLNSELLDSVGMNEALYTA